MQSVQSPITGNNNLRPKSGRTPLKPRNSQPPLTLTEIQILKPISNPKPNQEDKKKGIDGERNKENNLVHATPPPAKKLVAEALELDASLAEELSAIKKKLERLKIEREKTEKMLRERELLLDIKMKEMEERGEVQKMLENEVDRLFRLKELQSYSLRSPIRSLREKEQEKKIPIDGVSKSPVSSSCSNSNSIGLQPVDVK